MNKLGRKYRFVSSVLKRLCLRNYGVYEWRCPKAFGYTNLRDLGFK